MQNNTILIRDYQTSSYCQGDWGPIESRLGDAYGLLPLVGVPTIIGYGLGSWLAYTFFTLVLLPFSIVPLWRIVRWFV